MVYYHLQHNINSSLDKYLVKQLIISFQPLTNDGIYKVGFVCYDFGLVIWTIKGSILSFSCQGSHLDLVKDVHPVLLIVSLTLITLPLITLPVNN